MIPSGGFSPTRVALAQFGSTGAAAASVGRFVGVTAMAVVSTGSVTCGVMVGKLATSVNDSPAWTVCATAVEITVSCCTGEPHAAASSIKLTITTTNLQFRNSDIQISFLRGCCIQTGEFIIPFNKKTPGSRRASQNMIMESVFLDRPTQPNPHQLRHLPGPPTQIEHFSRQCWTNPHPHPLSCHRTFQSIPREA